MEKCWSRDFLTKIFYMELYEIACEAFLHSMDFYDK